MTPDKLVGSSELADEVISRRAPSGALGRSRFGQISNESVRRLIDLAYFASQVQEEGKYSHFRLHVPAPTNVPADFSDPWTVLSFNPSVPIRTIEDIRKLAPCAGSHDFALQIMENGSYSAELECSRVVLSHSGWDAVELFKTSLWAAHFRPGLMIRVDGPGQLRVSESGSTWDLRGGNLISTWGSMAPIHDSPSWLATVVSNFSTGPAGSDEHAQIEHVIFSTWAELIQKSSEAGRGGCFVILPERRLTPAALSKYEIDPINYPVHNTNIGHLLADFVRRSRRDALRSDDAATICQNGKAWLWQRHRIRTTVESLARASGVDGCTVFDADLNLIGFGGKMRAKAEKPIIDDRAPESGTPNSQVHGGTRHGSAYRLCSANPNVWAYVVSQDGPVTRFRSDHTNVYQLERYYPWVSPRHHR